MQINQLVTIAIPTYKRLNYLKEAVSSALAQTYPNIEVLIGQDPSQDGLDESIRDWCEKLVAREPKVRYQYNSHNLGLAGNWNACADSAKGEYIVIIGDDDRLLPNFVENLLNEALSDTQVIFSNHYLINFQGDRLETESIQWTNQYHRHLIPAGKISQAEKWVWQTKDVQRLRFQEDLNTPEIEFFLRLAQEGGSFVFVPEYLCEYRTHALSETTRGHWIEKLFDYLSKTPVTPEILFYKRKLLSEYGMSLVHEYLLKGKWEEAKNFLESEYHPQWQTKHVKSLIQSFCLNLPPIFGIQLYRLVSNMRSSLR
jgi:glycosyltransferase involved in cell wall biosynthesis